MRNGLATCLVALSLSVTPVAAQTAPPPPMPVDVQALGPQPGARVPDFSLTDQAGVTHTLRSLLGPKGAMLVFNRSADW